MKTFLLSGLIFLISHSFSAGQEAINSQFAFQSSEEKTNPWDISKIDEGQIIDLKDVNFEMDKSELTEPSKIVLNSLVDFMLTNKTLKIEVRGHTNNIPPAEYCNALSKSRADAVKSYLVGQGVHIENITTKGYGKRVPIASNLSPDGRKANQRVDIKILSL